jgi:2-polyprenyl-6-methoxyphenol hydroxylase-like FAD-dependent oxidoreductase
MDIPTPVATARTLRGDHVVVVGAGVGGMAVSLPLARAGAHVTLLERGRATDAEGAGILLQPNGLAC